MGQYYKCVNLDAKESVRPDMLKLMEHSWIKNDTLQSIELLLIPGARWYNQRIVWAGDYADEESIDSEFYQIIDKDVMNLNALCGTKFMPLSFLIEAIPSDYIYIVNFDKKEYVNKTKLSPCEDNTDYTIHPLPLLTAEGNGRGGGDFRGEDPNNLIGSWARNRIGVRNAIPEGFTELIFDLVEL